MANDDSALRAVPRVKEIDEFVDFWQWLRSGSKRFKLVGIAGIVVPALAVAYYITQVVTYRRQQ